MASLPRTGPPLHSERWAWLTYTDLQAQYQEWLINQGIMQTSGFNDGTYPSDPYGGSDGIFF
ncbi:MAG: hypothetical protein ACYSW0_21750 [Planctomycetota bacterium]